MRLVRTIPLSLLLFAPTWLLPAEAEACSCVQPPPPRAALAAAAAVFEGKVTNLDNDPASHRLTATIAVSRVWKGPVTAVTKVSTIDASSMCGLSFTVGESFVIYADGEAGSLSTSMCSRSGPSATAKDDLKALGAGKPPGPGEPVEPARPAEPVAPVEPTKPVAPTKPATPVEPTKPTTPVAPTEPVAPVAPTEPPAPAQPPASATGCTIAGAGPVGAAWFIPLLLLRPRRRAASRPR